MKKSFLLLCLAPALINSAKAQVCAANGNNLQYNSSTATHNNSNPVTYTYAAGTGANRLMVVIITHESQSANQSNDFSSITYGGQAMTQGANVQIGGSGGNFSNRIAIYYLKEAGIAAATNTTVTINYTNSNNIKGVGVSTIMLKNVHQTTTVENAQTNTSTTSSISVPSFATDNGDFVIAGVNHSQSGNSVTQSSGYTFAHNNTVTGSHKHGFSYKQITANGNETPGFTTSSGDRTAMAALEVNPNSTGGSCLFLLPTRLTFISAILQNQYTVVKWETADDNNVDHYILERSDYYQNNFYNIGSVDATARPGSKKYEFIDPSPVHGPTYYRIKVIDKSGRPEYSNILQVKPGNIKRITAVSPFDAIVQMLIPASTKQQATVIIHSTTGLLVYKEIINLLPGTNSIILQPDNNLAAGLYLLTVDLGKERQVIKIVKQ
jgi:hypothetical protein